MAPHSTAFSPAESFLGTAHISQRNCPAGMARNYSPKRRAEVTPSERGPSNGSPESRQLAILAQASGGHRWHRKRQGRKRRTAPLTRPVTRCGCDFGPASWVAIGFRNLSWWKVIAAGSGKEVTVSNSPLIPKAQAPRRELLNCALSVSSNR